MIKIISNKLISKNYNFSYNRVKKNIKMCIISDIHISSCFNMDNLLKIKKMINDNNPDYIFIVGDIIDSLNSILDNNIILFYDWLDNLGNINNIRIPVIVVLGNHDYYSYSGSRFNKYINSLKKLNICLLRDSIFEDDNIRVVGLDVPSSVYSLKYSFVGFGRYINNLDKKIFNLSNDKVNINLIHNPLFIFNSNVNKYFINFDLIFSGHMHNGMMLPFMEKIFKGNSGIIDPNKKLFPKYCRNNIDINNNNNLVISGGITKLSKSSKKLRWLNFIFPMEITFVNISC